jgi:hypothetical protein
MTFMRVSGDWTLVLDIPKDEEAAVAHGRPMLLPAIEDRNFAGFKARREQDRSGVFGRDGPGPRQ